MKFSLLSLLLWMVLGYAPVALPAQDFISSPYMAGAFSEPIVADFNGDKKPDVMGINYFTASPNRVLLRINQGGTPLEFVAKPLGIPLKAAGLGAVGDWDGDGDMDVIMPEDGTLRLHLLRNAGDASFTVTPLALPGAQRLKTADVDKDGQVDCVGINPDSNAIYYYHNVGGAFSSIRVGGNIGALQDIALGDIDKDGDVDIVVGLRQFDKQVLLFRNKGVQGFEEVTIGEYFLLRNLDAIEIEDINGDGRQDVVVAGSSGVYLLANNGTNSYKIEDLRYGFEIVRSIAVGDFNGDGKQDYVLGRNSTEIIWYKNTGTLSTFEMRNVGTVSPAYSVVAADLDGDKDLDLVVTNGEFWFYTNNIPQEVPVVQIADKQVSVRPNPFRDALYIDSEGTGYHLTLTDARSRTVFASSTPVSGEVRLPSLPAGWYALTLTEPRTNQFRTALVYRSE